MESGHHIISLDLGFAGEPTALAVVKPKTAYRFATAQEDDLAWTNSFDVVHLERFPPSVGFPRVVARTKEIGSDRKRIPDYSLLVNTSSAGPAALKLFEERRLEPRRLMIVNGSVGGRREQVELVPKGAMIGATQVLLQAERLRIASALELGSTLRDELLNFRMTPPKVDTLEAMRENANDDLTFSVALACWWGESPWSSGVGRNFACGIWNARGSGRRTRRSSPMSRD